MKMSPKTQNAQQRPHSSRSPAYLMRLLRIQDQQQQLKLADIKEKAAPQPLPPKPLKTKAPSESAATVIRLADLERRSRMDTSGDGAGSGHGSRPASAFSDRPSSAFGESPEMAPRVALTPGSPVSPLMALQHRGIGGISIESTGF